MIMSIITVAKTGRLIVNSDKFIILICAVFCHTVNSHRHSGSQLHNTCGEQSITNILSTYNLNRRRGTHTCDNLYLLSYTVSINIVNIATHLLNTRYAGYYNCILGLVELYLDASRLSRFNSAVAIIISGTGKQTESV